MPRSNNSDARDMLELEELSNSYDLAMTERDIEARVAVLIPCYNEELTIPNVVRDFRRALPEAVVYVYDNNSRDRTCDVARTAGAVIGFENMQGKGNVIRRMFADAQADIVSSSMATIHMMPGLRRGSFPCFGTTSSTW